MNKIKIEAKFGIYSIIADDEAVCILRREGNVIEHVGNYIKDKTGSSYSQGYDKGLKHAAIIYEGRLSLSEDMRAELGVSETKKEEPKTFGWDEAYRLMKEGKRVVRKSWSGNEKFLCLESYEGLRHHLSIYCKKEKFVCDINTEELDATDWYVYEE